MASKEEVDRLFKEVKEALTRAEPEGGPAKLLKAMQSKAEEVVPTMSTEEIRLSLAWGFGHFLQHIHQLCHKYTEILSPFMEEDVKRSKKRG